MNKKAFHWFIFWITALAFIALCGYARYQFDKVMFLHYQRATSTKGVCDGS